MVWVVPATARWSLHRHGVQEKGLYLRRLHLHCKHVLQAGVGREGIMAERALANGFDGEAMAQTAPSLLGGP